MYFKILAVVTHLTTGYSATVYTDNNYLNYRSCMRAIPLELKMGYKKARRIAHQYGLDGRVRIEAKCVQIT